jgi:hypothetical protein
MRFQRLNDYFQEDYVEGSMPFRTEECIAEVGAMVIAYHMGILNDYTKIVMVEGIKANYKEGMIIPIREIRAAVNYYADDETNFNEGIDYVQNYLQMVHQVQFAETYPARVQTA